LQLAINVESSLINRRNNQVNQKYQKKTNDTKEENKTIDLKEIFRGIRRIILWFWYNRLAM